MTSPKKDLDELAISSRLLRKTVPGVEIAGTSATASGRQLETVEATLVVDIPYRSLKVNIEREDLLDHIMRMCATQIGNDEEDLGFVGDVASDDDFLKINDGWVKIAKAEATVFDTAGSADYWDVILPGMYDALDDKYKSRPDQLLFLVKPTVEHAIRRKYAEMGWGDTSFAFVDGRKKPPYMEVPIVGIPYIPTGTHMLTHPKNLAFGMDITGIEREFDRAPKKRVISVVMTIATDFEVKKPEALVIGYDVTPE
jgi:hypothetical protein